MSKKNGRPGRNPTQKEVQLKGMLQALSVTAEKLEQTNKVLTTEASGVLEALWNGHQNLVVQVAELREQVDAMCATPESDAASEGTLIESVEPRAVAE